MTIPFSHLLVTHKTVCVNKDQFEAKPPPLACNIFDMGTNINYKREKKIQVHTVQLGFFKQFTCFIENLFSTALGVDIAER